MTQPKRYTEEEIRSVIRHYKAGLVENESWAILMNLCGNNTLNFPTVVSLMLLQLLEEKKQLEQKVADGIRSIEFMAAQ